jgi:hypothetical protein
MYFKLNVLYIKQKELDKKLNKIEKIQTNNTPPKIKHTPPLKNHHNQQQIQQISVLKYNFS